MDMGNIDPVNRTTGILYTFDCCTQQFVGVSSEDIAPEQRQHFFCHYVVYVSAKYKNEVMGPNYREKPSRTDNKPGNSRVGDPTGFYLRCHHLKD